MNAWIDRNLVLFAALAGQVLGIAVGIAVGIVVGMSL